MSPEPNESTLVRSYSTQDLFDEMVDTQNTMGENLDGTWGVKKPKSLWLLLLYAI